MIKGIIFDLDGTLLNTIGDICHVLNESLKAFSLPAVTEEETRAFVGDGARVLVERAVKGADADTAEKVYRHYSKAFSECPNDLTELYPEEAETLLRLKERGIKFAVVTNKPQRATENVCAKYLGGFGFDHISGQSEAFPLKPDPASTLGAVQILGLKREECLFVGDGETDVRTARAAGIKCLSALWGYRSEAQLKKAGAECFIHRFSDIEKYV